MRLIFLVFLGFVSLTLTRSGAVAQGAQPPLEPGRIMIVMDASGSMNARVQGKVKMTIARQTLRDLVGTWDEALHLGLMSYGHRRKDDCRDIELLVPVGPVNARRIPSIVDKLTPIGKTPLTEAVRLAAQSLRYEENQATVVLISDGEETCDADPCALGTELKEAGVDFKVHVIGFAVKPEEQAGLKCLAENTGGRFFDARDPAALREALDITVEQVKQETGPRLRFNVVLKPGEEPLEPGFYANGLTWQFFAADGSGEKAGPALQTQSGAQISANLDAGAYLAELRWDAVRARYPFAVEQDVRALHTVDLNAAILTLDASLTEESPALQGQVGWTFFAVTPDGGRGEQIASRFDPAPQAVVPAGEIEVVAKFDNAAMPRRLTLAAGERRAESVALDAGTVTLRAVDGAGAPLRGHQTWRLIPDRADADVRAAFKSGPGPSFTLRSGRYALELGINQTAVKGEIEVAAGEERTIDVTLP